MKLIKQKNNSIKYKHKEMIELTIEEAKAMIAELQKLPFESVAGTILFLDNKIGEVEPKVKEPKK
jgi:hypothetical protein